MRSIFDDGRHSESTTADRQKISRFREALETPGTAPADPRPEIIQRHLQIYLGDRPAPHAIVSLAFAFDQWRRLDRIYGEMAEFLSKIQKDEGSDLENPWDQARLWDEVGGAVIGSSQRDGRREQGLKDLESFAQSLTTDIGRAFLLFMTARAWIREDKTDTASRISEQILQIDTSNCPEYVERTARGCIQEHRNVQLGAEAPQFRTQDLEGELIDLSQMRGRAALLHFWTTTCPFCPAELEFVRAARAKYSDCLQVIGVAMDEEPTSVASHLETHPTPWPQIHDRDRDLSVLYNVLEVPSNYLVNRDGRLVGKRFREHEIEQTIEATMTG